MVRGKVTAFGDQGNVPISLAQNLIEVSAYWIDHPQGIIHPEPGMANNIVKGPHGWEIKFGANYFLVERAILLCKSTILDELDRLQTLSQAFDPKVLYGRLITCVRKSVAAYDHNTFPYYTGGASLEIKSQGYYTADSSAYIKMLPRLTDFKRYGITPPSKDIWGGFMKFGVHAIKVGDFVRRIQQKAGLGALE